MNLILLTDDMAIDTGAYRLTQSQAEHVRTILRAQSGDTLQVGLLDGPVGTARIERLTESEVVIRCETLTDAVPLLPTIDLICALPRPQTLKKVLLTAATMGVRRIHLIRANRVEKSFFHSPLLEPERYTPFLLEGLSQGKLTRLPDVQVHDRFKRFFEDTLPEFESHEPDPALKIVPDLDTGAHLRTVYSGEETRLLIAIGPEGGWVPFEVELLQGRGFQRVTLGRFTLRVETAVTAALSQVELIRAMAAERRPGRSD